MYTDAIPLRNFDLRLHIKIKGRDIWLKTKI